MATEPQGSNGQGGGIASGILNKINVDEAQRNRCVALERGRHPPSKQAACRNIAIFRRDLDGQFEFGTLPSYTVSARDLWHVRRRDWFPRAIMPRQRAGVLESAA